MNLNELYATQQVGFPMLSALIFLPLGILLMLGVIRDQKMGYQLALWGSVAELALAGMVPMREFSADMQLVERFGLFMGMEYHLGVDGISALFVPLTALLTLLAILYAEPAAKTDVRQYLMAMLGLEATMVGAFVSLDLMLFWVFFVLELFPSYLLITKWGTGEKRREAAGFYVTIMAAGSALMLAGILMLGMNASQAGKEHIFDFLTLLTVPLSDKTQSLVFFMLFFGLAIKAPIFPFHTWMPRVLEQGPVVGMSIFLVGLKLGTYGFLRFVIPLVPDASKEWFWLMALLGTVGMVYGAAIAMIQTNLRRLLAFASLSHMGVVMLGIFSLNFAGFQGGLLQMINLGIAGAGLFFIAGFLYTRLGQPDLSVLGGVERHAPVLAMTFLVIGLAGIGLPGTGGFNGEHLVMIGAYKVHWLMALATGIGTVLTATYFFRYFLLGFLGEPSPAPANPHTVATMPDIQKREMVIATALAAMIFWIGLDSGPFLRTMDGSLKALEQRVQQGATVHTATAPAVTVSVARQGQ